MGVPGVSKFGAMNVPLTALFYSNDLGNSPVVEYCLCRLAAQVARFGELITVTWRPLRSLGAHHVGIEWSDCEASHRTLFRQILAGLDHASDGIVFLCEHDVLYPDDYFPEMAEAACEHGMIANRNIIHLCPAGFFPADHSINFLSNIAGCRPDLQSMIAAKVKELAAGKLVFAEPQGNEIATIFCSNPTVDVRHGRNFTGMRTAERYRQTDPVYGDANEYRWAFGWPVSVMADDPMLSRTDILNELIARRRLRSYLEVGLLDPAQNFDHVRAPIKESVDPNVPATHQMTSDRFFSELARGARYDLIFIDAVHEEEQALRDMRNALSHLSLGGAIVVHDCSPPTEWHQRPFAAFVPGTEWNGTIWRALVRFRAMYPHIAVHTVDADWGCAVICPGDPETPPASIPTQFGWADLERNRRDWLNLISPAAFKALIRGRET
jgi:hypothetical protein